ncbi:MAG: MarR family winged helix-turn-helix transcriptional regulator [Anaerolineae bacterium]|nr:MarR family transcriptional regulator [Chloroflexota bacterium]
MFRLKPPNALIAHLIPRITHRYHRRIQRMLDDLGLHRGQPLLLAVLWEREGLMHTELSEYLGVTPATITKMAQRLEQSGFIYREPDSVDQRISRVYLTEQGRAVRQQVDAVFDSLESQMMTGFSGEERAQFQDYLTRVAHNLRTPQDVRPWDEGPSEDTAEELQSDDRPCDHLHREHRHHGHRPWDDRRGSEADIAEPQPPFATREAE